MQRTHSSSASAILLYTLIWGVTRDLSRGKMKKSAKCDNMPHTNLPCAGQHSSNSGEARGCLRASLPVFSNFSEKILVCTSSLLIHPRPPCYPLAPGAHTRGARVYTSVPLEAQGRTMIEHEVCKVCYTLVSFWIHDAIDAIGNSILLYSEGINSCRGLRYTR